MEVRLYLKAFLNTYDILSFFSIFLCINVYVFDIGRTFEI